MIIGIDASRANRAHKTGTEWYSYYLIRALAKIDRDNQYILYTDKPLRGGLLDLTTTQYEEYEPDRSGDDDRVGWQEIKSPFNNFRAKILSWPFYFFWTQGRLSLEMAKGGVDLLFIPAHTLPWIHPAKTIVTIHDIGFERERLLYRYEKMGPESQHGRRLIDFFVRIFTLNKYGANSLDYLSWSTRFALKHANRIIAVSEHTKKDIQNIYGTAPDKIAVVHNGYNDCLFNSDHSSLPRARIFSKYEIKTPFILYVGRLEKKKNTAALVEAYANLLASHPGLPHQLVLIGDAGYGYDEVNYAIKELNLDARVVMPGWAEELDLPEIFSAADLFVFPSQYEGFGLPLLQAMACQVPVAAAGVSAIPEVAGEAALYFQPDDVLSMAKAMAEILTDEKLRRRLIRLGNENIKKYSWDKCARETLTVFHSLS
ncbi:hypothetical protein COX69_02810 [Candidatus Falkowbacteria bacterium CG_4_10_14_0_2_um_filter_48_10]|nr:MAG: hypothetical protein COX69_02810 [Candidatus Falkowbacteria bacterium CG_4_10_14_0_2_um_filter_48_10]